MSKHDLIYDPPLSTNLQALKDHLLTSVDYAGFVHIGHFVSWYAACEFMIGTILMHITGGGDPKQFDVLTRGMDARVKVERLRQAADIAGIEIPLAFDDRLDHFTKAFVGLRNKLVHSYLHWTDERNLEVCSIGAPPQLSGLDIPAFAPEIISEMELFERSIWLKAFAIDLGELTMALPQKRTLQKDAFHAHLPKGHQPRQKKRDRQAKRGKRPRHH